jgi:hypothetical protein
MKQQDPYTIIAAFLVCMATSAFAGYTTGKRDADAEFKVMLRAIGINTAIRYNEVTGQPYIKVINYAK